MDENPAKVFTLDVGGKSINDSHAQHEENMASE